MNALLQDVRYGLRILAKSPGFTAVALMTLALGICANITIFTFVNASLLRPLPYREPSRLVEVFDSRHMEVNAQFEASYPDYLDWSAQQDVFGSMAGFNGPRGTILTGGGSPERLATAYVTDTFFRTLGIEPARGRDFRSGEDLEAAPRTIILSYGTWQRRFGGREDAVGKTLTLDGEPHTIIGVLPQTFQFALVGEPDVWVTLHAQGGLKTRRNLHWLSVIGRLKLGVSQEQAFATMNAIAQRLEQQYPASNRDLRTVISPLTDQIVGPVKPILLVLLSAVGMLLLIACANVANLLLARSATRKKEIAIRASLGAARTRLVRQLLTEGLVLVAVGGAAGLIGARLAVAGLLGALPQTMTDSMPYLRTTSMDTSFIAFTLGITMITGLLFALAPALQLSSQNFHDALKEGERSSSGPSWRRFGSGLVIGEVALAVVLLVGAGLLLRSLYRLLQVNLGFTTEHGIMVRVSTPAPPGKTPQEQNSQLIARHHRILNRISALPGIQSAGTTNIMPVSNGGNTIMFRIVGKPFEGQGSEANIREVSPGYFPTLQAQLVRGRWFTDADDDKAPQRVIVNQTFANRYFPGEDPVGKQIVFTYSPTQKSREIVGLLKDVREGPLDVPVRPALYTPEYQGPNAGWAVVVRGSQAEAVLIRTVEDAIREVEPNAVVFNSRTLEDLVNASPSALLHRYPAWLVSGFAGIALLLAVVGLYGVVAYSVSQRTREIGVRMALGAQRSDVLRMVLGEGGRLVAIGIGTGMAAAVVVATLMRSFLFGVRAWDAATLAAVTGAMAAVALLASYVPARRATKVDPMVALRYE